MPIPTDASAQFSAVYDTERAQWNADHKSKPWWKPKPVTVTLEGGPLHGWTKDYEDQGAAPDYYEGPGGHYYPYLTKPTTYRWMPDAEDR